MQYAGVNFIDTSIRGGKFPPPPSGFPLVSGGEAGGVIVKLPTDPKVLADADYKIRQLKEGAAVVAVSLFWMLFLPPL